MINQVVYLTPQGLDELKKELSNLVETRRPQLVSRLSLARSMGDLSENSDYITAKEELSFTDGRIAELEDLIKNAKIPTPSGTDSVDIGHAVTVKVNGTQHVFSIVGEWEANPAEKKISPSSPLGQALIGRKVGDQVEVPAPAGKVIYTILKIAN